MTEYGYSIYESIINATGSELILFFIILAIFFAVITIPLYTMMLKGRKADKVHELEREKQVLDVIKDNSKVMASLTTVLENSGASTKESFDRIHDRIDEQGKVQMTMTADIAQINTKLDASSDNQKEIASKVNKLLLIVAGKPNEAHSEVKPL